MLTVGLVGATNVGKSTLFNRLIGQFRAIVTDIAGTTQDILRHSYHHNELGDMEFADSPGLLSFEDERPFIKNILDTSSVLLFVVDAEVGITAKEHRINDYIQQHNLSHKVILTVNKMDKELNEDEYYVALSDYFALGYEYTVGLSAKTSKNIGLLRPMIETIIQQGIEKGEMISERNKSSHIQIAIVGKPNAGKSTLINTLAKEQVSKVEDKAGTTLDYISTVITHEKFDYEIIDTAGIKKLSRTHGLEKIAYEKTIGMLKYNRPIVIYLLDITQGLSHRDMTLIEEIHNKALPMIVAVNKTDTIEKTAYKKYVEDLSKRFAFAKYIPIVPLSGLQGKGLGNLFKMVRAVHKESRTQITTGELNKVVMKEFITRPPRFPKNKICKILYMTQVNANPPRFVVFINHKNRANFAFKRWLENTIRQHYGFVGCPLVFDYREREQKKHGENDNDFNEKQDKKNQKFEERKRRPKKNS